MTKRRYKRKTEDLEDEGFRIVLGLTMLAVMYFGFVYYTDQVQFWYEIKKYVIPVIGAVVLLLGAFFLFVYRKARKQDNHIDSLFQKISESGFDIAINNFIDRFGKEGKGDPWKYRGYSFDWDRLKDFRESVIQNGISVSTKDYREFLIVIKHFIDSKEKDFLNAGIVAKVSHNLNELNKEGDDFEHLIVRLYNAMGYESKRIGGHGDQGGDVIASKNGENVLIQAKCYSNSVGNAAVQQAVGARQYYGCTSAVVITTAMFTSEAKSLAKANSVELIDGVILKQNLLKYLHEMWV